MENFHRDKALKLIRILEQFTEKVVNTEGSVEYTGDNVYMLQKIYNTFEDAEDKMRMFLKNDTKKIKKEREDEREVKQALGPYMCLYTLMKTLKDEKTCNIKNGDNKENQ
jgi:hypothetical protein